MKIKSWLLSFLMLTTFFCSIGLAQVANFKSIRWELDVNAPVYRSEGTSVVVGNKLYMMGGFLSTSSSYTGTDWFAKDLVQTFEPGVGFRSESRLPIPLTHAAADTDGRYIYVVGGYSTVNGRRTWATEKGFKYDTVSKVWTTLPNLPYPRGGGALVLLNNRLHYFGGADKDRRDTRGHFVLDLANLPRGWVQVGVMPEPRNHMGAVVLGGKIYAVAGQTGTDEGSVSKSELFIYNPVGNVWSRGASYPFAVSHHGASTLAFGGRLIVIAGMLRHPSPFTNNVKAYNPNTNTWANLTNYPLSTHSGMAGVINGKLYYTGGNFSNRTYRGTPQLVR